MTNETTYREKGRSLFLAAMLVLSVVAMSAAFAGGAAADAAVNEDNYDEGPAYQAGDDVSDVWIGQQIEFTDFSSDESGIEVYQGLDEDGEDESPVTTLRVDSEDNNATLDTTDLEAGEPYTLVGSQHWAPAADGPGEIETFWTDEEALNVEFSSDTVAEDGEVNIDFESERNTQTVNVTSDDLDGSELFDIFNPGEDDSEANFKGLYSTDGSYENGAYGGDYDGDTDVSTELHDDDDVLTIVGLDEGEDALTADFSGELSEGDESEFDFSNTDSLASDNASVEVTDDAENRQFADIDSIEEGEQGNITLDVGNSDEAAFSFGDNSDNHVVNMTLENFDTDNDEVVLEYNTNKAGVDGDTDSAGYELPADAGPVETTAAEYGWNAENATITEFYTASGLDEDETLPAETWDVEVGAHGGDNLNNLDSDEDHQIDQADFVDSSDDYGTFQISERSAPSDAVTQTAPAADNAHSFDDYEDATITDTDSIAAVADGEDSQDGDSLYLSVDDFNANGSITQLEEELGAYDQEDADIGATLFEQTGISIELEQQDTGAISSGSSWNSSAAVFDENGDVDTDEEGNAYEIEGSYTDTPANNLQIDLLTAADDDYNGELIFEIDYQQAMDNGLEVGDSYNAHFNISEEESSLIDEDYSDSSEVSIEEPSVELDDVEEMPANADSTATGTTNVAPGSEITTIADSPSDEGAFVDTDDANVSADGTFEASFDLANEQVGSMFDLTADDPFGDDDAEVEGVTLVESTDDNESDEEGIGLDVESDDVEENETAEIDAIVENFEDENTTVDINLTIDGETYDRTVDLEGDDSTTQTFAFEDDNALGVGEYDFDVTAESDNDNESASGTLTVNEAGSGDDGSEDGSEDGGSEDGGSEDGDTGSEDDDSDDGDDGDSVPGFGVAVALVALLSAAMLALRKQD